MIFNPVYGGASAPSLGSKTITSNGAYLASSDRLDGYSEVDVSVPNTYAAGDEGKVVSNGALVAQTSVTKTANGTYDTTLNDEVVVDVQGTKVYDVTSVDQYAINFTPSNNANSAKSGGFTFTSSKRIKISKIRIFARGVTASGYISQSGTTIASVENATVTDGQWNDLTLNNAVALEPNTTYLVWYSLNGTALKYTSSTLTPSLAYITKGTTYYSTSANTLPTNSESVTTYGVDFYVDGYLDERQNVDSVLLGAKTVTQNGTYNAEDDGLDGYSSVAVSAQPTLQAKTGLTITANGSFSYTPDVGYDGLSEVSGTVNVSGGGGTPGIYAGTTAPTSDIGSDGDYYYERANSSNWVTSYTPSGSSGTTIYGAEFTANKNLTITALRGMCRAAKTGYIRIGTTSSVLAQTDSISFTANAWAEGQLSSSVTLQSGTNYIIQVVITSGGSGNIAYTQNSSSASYDSSLASYVRSRYGSYPGSTESGSYIGVDFVAEHDYYMVTHQYIKESGAWSQIA